MAISTDVSSILSYCEGLPAECQDLARTASRLLSGWQHVDKLRMDSIIQSVYHIQSVLKSLASSTHEITRVEVDTSKSRIDDLRYEDFEDLTPELLQKRTEDWYVAVQDLGKNLAFVIRGLEAVGMRPMMTHFLRGHLWVDLMFFERQYKKALGVTLPSSLLLSSGQ